MLSLGWWLAPITLYHLLPLCLDAASWRELFPAANRPARLSFLWMRWIRESVSTLLPVAGVGGDVVGARLANQRGVSGAQATASMVVDVTVGSATQLVFVLVGVGLLTASKTHDAAATAWGLTIGVAIFAAAIAIFVRLQHSNMFAILIGWADRLAPKSWMSGFADRAEPIDDAIVATYRRRFALSYSSLLRLVGWAIGTGEVWMATRVLGHPLNLIDSFILESLQQRRSRRGVHGARRVGRPGERHGPVRSAARAARGSGARGFSDQAGSRTGAWPAGPCGLAMGGRAPLACSPGGQGELHLVVIYWGGGIV